MVAPHALPHDLASWLSLEAHCTQCFNGSVSVKDVLHAILVTIGARTVARVASALFHRSLQAVRCTTCARPRQSDLGPQNFAHLMGACRPAGDVDAALHGGQGAAGVPGVAHLVHEAAAQPRRGAPQEGRRRGPAGRLHHRRRHHLGCAWRWYGRVIPACRLELIKVR